MAKQDPISFMEFKQRFSNEEACRDYLYHMRWPDGFVCLNIPAKESHLHGVLEPHQRGLRATLPLMGATALISMRQHTALYELSCQWMFPPTGRNG